MTSNRKACQYVRWGRLKIVGIVVFQSHFKRPPKRKARVIKATRGIK
jgi:hypothetical protein